MEKQDSKERFQDGDVVQLKSGGPPMTVENVPNPYTILRQLREGESPSNDPDPDEVMCRWVDSEGKCHERRFPITSLRRVEESGNKDNK